MGKKMKGAPSKKAGGQVRGGKTKGNGSSGGSSKGKGKGKGDDSNRKLSRQEQREAHRHSLGRMPRRAQGGNQAIEETRQRLRMKALQRQLLRGPSVKPGEERRTVLRDLGLLHAGAGRSAPAIEALEEALNISPEDPDFSVRGPLLCLYLDGARTEEATSMLKGPLFESLLAEAPIGQPPSSTSSEFLMAKKAAATTGCYSIAVLSYVSVCVLQEYRKKPTEGQAAE
ncbi:unnamed protein product, partial [Polarella glacialis]